MTGIEWRPRSGRDSVTRRTILVAMGFNPHRQYRRSNADYVVVAAALLVCLLLVGWALVG